MTANLPAGYSQASLPMGGDQKGIYDMLRSVVQRGQGGFESMGRLAAGDQSEFAAREAPAMRQLQQQILPGLAQRYGAGGVGQSSGFQNAATAAGTDLAERLQGQRMDIQQNALQQLLGLSKDLLGTPTEQQFLVEDQQSQWPGLFGSLASAGMSMIPGMAQASAIGNLFSSLQSKREP